MAQGFGFPSKMGPVGLGYAVSSSPPFVGHKRHGWKAAQVRVRILELQFPILRFFVWKALESKLGFPKARFAWKGSGDLVRMKFSKTK